MEIKKGKKENIAKKERKKKKKNIANSKIKIG